MEILSKDKMKSFKVLLVDDDSFALRVIRHIVYELKFENIEETFNGEAAREVLNKQKIDLLITDVEMPKLNGLGLLKSIRCGETAAPRDLPIIIITSLSSSEVLTTSLALDVNGFLAKPLKPVDVFEKISTALNEINSIKPIADYGSIETDLKLLRRKSNASAKSVNASILLDQTEDLKKGAPKTDVSQVEENRFFIRELKPGMRINQDLYLKDGSLLLKAGYTLSEATINRLGELREILADESLLIVPAEAEKES